MTLQESARARVMLELHGFRIGDLFETKPGGAGDKLYTPGREDPRAKTDFALQAYHPEKGGAQTFTTLDQVKATCGITDDKAVKTNGN